jgi:phenylacetic acid degradation operon negative regulatory protein
MAIKNNARALILDLLFAQPDAMISTRQFALAAQLFGISENSVRVALTRLSSDSLIESAGRGIYRLTEQAKEISEPVVNRAQGIKNTRQWTGSYLAVHTAVLGRADRTALKRRERTLRLNGFRELQPDLFIRPDNLAEDYESTRQHLISTGLDARATMFIANHFDEESHQKIPSLWDKKALNDRYKKTSQHVQSWLGLADQLELEVAARESLLIGRQAIPLMMTDPLLPEPFIDLTLQQQFFSDVQKLDQKGHQFWQQLAAQAIQ